MPWVRFTDDYLANDKITRLSAYARLLDMAAIVYSARELRDGHLSMADVETVAAVARVPRWQRSVAELVAANRWMPESSGYIIHDYLDYQPSRAHVLAERAAARDRQRARRTPGDVRPDIPRTSEEISPDSGRSSNHPVPGTRYPYPEVPNGTSPGVPTPNPFPPEGAETGAEPPSPRPRSSPRTTGTNPRSTGANPRATAVNPRATGTNPRRRRSSSSLDFDEHGPRYEQRTGADGKREWVEVEA